MELSTLLSELLARQGSDIHLVVGQPPVFRIDGALTRRDGPVLDAASTESLLLPHLTEEQRAALTGHRQDVSTSIRHDGRTFRCYVFHERGRLGAAIRPLPQEVPTLEDLGIGDESVLHSIIKSPRGLVLVTGPTGSGKSTTCAAMLETINRTTAARIIVIEDAPDYQFTSKQGLVTELRVGEDVESFEQGAITALNTDLDVALIGEIRSMETARLALVMAETGHLVFSVLHADSASEAIQRLVEGFPEPRDTIRRMLARNLIAIISQRLLLRADRPGRVAAHEILLATPRIRQMIVEGQADLILAIEAGRDRGMQTMDDAVLNLYRAGTMTYETAWHQMEDRERLGPSPGAPP